jgi:hypothetical protein
MAKDSETENADFEGLVLGQGLETDYTRVIAEDPRMVAAAGWAVYSQHKPEDRHDACFRLSQVAAEVSLEYGLTLTDIRLAAKVALTAAMDAYEPHSGRLTS